MPCPCGGQILDSTDYLPDKAHLVADQDLFDVMEPDAPDAIRDRLCDWSRLMWQCLDCGRLCVDDRDGVVHWFEPVDPAVPRDLLGSAHGERWLRPMAGVWRTRVDDGPNGALWWGPGEDEGFERFDVWEDLERRYHEVFTRLRDGGVLRSAFLRRGAEMVHRWPAE